MDLAREGSVLRTEGAPHTGPEMRGKNGTFRKLLESRVLGVRAEQVRSSQVEARPRALGVRVSAEGFWSLASDP